MLVWDPVSERNLPFGTLKTAALGVHSSVLLSTARMAEYVCRQVQERAQSASLL